MLEDRVADGRLREWVPTPRQALEAPELAPVGATIPVVPADGAGTEPVVDAPRRREALGATLRDLNPQTISGPRLFLYVLMFQALFGGWADQLAGLALPEIQASLGLSVAGVVSLNSFLASTNYIVGLPLGFLADRVKRVWLVRVTALGDALGNLLMSRAGSSGSYVGANALVTVTSDAGGPASVPLLADWFPSSSRGRVVALLTISGVIGGIASVAVSGVLIQNLGWRSALLALGLLSLVVAAATFLLREPVRGGIDRLESGMSAERAAQAPPPPSFVEALRGAFAIRTVRWLALAGLVTVVGEAPVQTVIQLTLADKFLLSPEQRSLISLITHIGSLPVLLFVGSVADRLLSRRPSTLMMLVGGLQLVNVFLLLAQGLAPNVVLYTIPAIVSGILTVLIAPATIIVLSLVLPARFRGTGLQVTTPFVFIGTLLTQVVDRSATGSSPQQVLLLFIPFLAFGALLYVAAASGVSRDIRAARASAAALDEVDRAAVAGREKILVCRDLDVAYDDVQVLFNVDLDVEAGEVLALVGTNGAGKSTLLRAICGLQQPANGAVFFDGREITSAPAHENARRGLIYMPGGQGVFPSLTVAENLTAAASLGRGSDATDGVAITDVYELFPVLAARAGTLAGTLSGGEQQMLALGQAFLMRPKLLLIDELSLGLAPAIVEQLLGIVRQMRDDGVTIMLVEQSLNVALTVADRAVFMERGEIQFDGPTEELLARPDLVRAVFMGGGGSSTPRPARPVDPATRDSDAPLLRAEGIDVRFGGVHALSGVDLSVEAGEVVGIIGPNGAGKTTLFDVLSGFLKPDAGTVFLGEHELTRLSPDQRARLGLGRAFQSARLFPPLTVRENISVALEKRASKSSVMAAVWAPGTRRNEKKLQERVDGFIELLGLNAYADKFVRELSTGTRRAVEVACQMAAEPKLLLLDEPSSGLAQAETEALGPALRGIVRETGCGMLIIEHDLPLVTRLSDRLIAMELGAVLLTGPPQTVLSDPAVLSSYLSASDAVIQRSGSRVGSVLKTVTHDDTEA